MMLLVSISQGMVHIESVILTQHSTMLMLQFKLFVYETGSEVPGTLLWFLRIVSIAPWPRTCGCMQRRHSRSLPHMHCHTCSTTFDVKSCTPFTDSGLAASQCSINLSCKWGLCHT